MAAMAKSSGEVLRLDFNCRLTVQFATIYRELDDALGLTTMAGASRCADGPE
jgi:hypothetical protein